MRTEVTARAGLLPLVSTLVLASLATACASRPPAADTVLINGGIYTVDAERRWAQAAAIRDGRFVAVGANREIEKYVRDGTRVIDLAGRMALPGFHDSHVHVAAAGLELLQCPLADLRSVDAILSAVAQCARKTPEGWVVGSGWDLSLFENSSPRKELLDGVVANRPVMLIGADGHSGWANSRALAEAGITAQTPNPVNGIIEKDPHSGEPLGTLRETAMDLVTAKVPPPTDATNLAGLKLGLELVNAAGITSFVEATAGESAFKAFGALASRGELTARTVLCWTYGSSADAGFETLLARRKEIAGPRINVDAIKIFVDGVLEGETAALLSPYLTHPSNSGSITMAAADLNAAVTRFDAMGLQVHMHAIGDAAVRAGLDAFEAARAKNGPGNGRHHIAHLQLVDPADLPRFHALDVAANFQAYWAWPDDYILKLNMPQVGPERVNRMYPIASARRADARIVGGSDWSVSTVNPLLAMQVAITRQDPDGVGTAVLNPGERVDLPTMIDAYTINGAWLMHQDDRTGSIETGKAADVVVLDRDLFKLAPGDIGKAQVDLTMLDGAFVYERAARSAAR